MWFDEPHPSPERSSPTRLNMSGQTRYKGGPCKIEASYYPMLIDFCTYDALKWSFLAVLIPSFPFRILYMGNENVIRPQTLWGCYIPLQMNKYKHETENLIKSTIFIRYRKEFWAAARKLHQFICQFLKVQKFRFWWKMKDASIMVPWSRISRWAQSFVL